MMVGRHRRTSKRVRPTDRAEVQREEEVGRPKEGGGVQYASQICRFR